MRDNKIDIIRSEKYEIYYDMFWADVNDDGDFHIYNAENDEQLLGFNSYAFWEIYALMKEIEKKLLEYGITEEKCKKRIESLKGVAIHD